MSMQLEHGRMSMPNVRELVTARHHIVLKEGQFFCRTQRAWEIWQTTPMSRLVRIEQKRILSVVE